MMTRGEGLRFAGAPGTDAVEVLAQEGCVQFPATEPSRAWAQTAHAVARELSARPALRQQNLRHGETWFVGVDLLPNDSSGAIGTQPFKGPWAAFLPADRPLHKAQVSILYPGYPQQDANESDANHRYRLTRRAAHVDGLLPEGPARRRYPREFHAYLLGVHLDDCGQAPTVFWRGSHHIMARALRDAIGSSDPADVDVTEAYHAARREVFETCEMVRLEGHLGASFLMHRFALHGTEVWEDAALGSQARMIAFFRPEFETAAQWRDAP